MVHGEEGIGDKGWGMGSDSRGGFVRKQNTSTTKLRTAEKNGKIKAGAQPAEEGRPRGARGDQDRQRSEAHSGRGADHLEGRGRRAAYLQPARQLLRDEAGRPGEVHGRGQVDRCLLAHGGHAAAEWPRARLSECITSS